VSLSLHTRDAWLGHTVVELGAGVGLVSTVLGRYADRVYCTDMLPEAVQLAKANVTRNGAWLGKPDVVRCRILHWATGCATRLDTCTRQTQRQQSSAGLNSTSRQLANATFFFGSDLIYDLSASNSFVFAPYLLTAICIPAVCFDQRAKMRLHVVPSVASLQRRRFFMALEKRFNF